MKVLEVSGDARMIGRLTGEAVREQTRDRLATMPPIEAAVWKKRLSRFVETLRKYLPGVLEEMEGTAEGVGVPADDILRLNFQMYDHELGLEGCTNVVFAAGPDGPIWGKNNEGSAEESRRPPCLRIIRRRGSIPLAAVSFCGTIGMDGMNAEGLASGHSSVGSVFQQSDYHVPILLWEYEGMLTCRTTEQFVRHMCSLPARGKGYARAVVDRAGAICALECPCPMTQVRKPTLPGGHMQVVNCYQLPTLAEADRRNPRSKRNALARAEMLKTMLAGDVEFSLADMKSLLRHHGEPSICRHGGDGSLTEYSLIGLPRDGRLLYVDGYPCENEYAEITL
ncbi:MAG: C45 family autoproteolytic acyltransferase/hydrolase [Syntrophaceae bacterium]|nr:C45 family autoproteolytic acyltransferase/hydrolase [Syntrophaceae bacterium]